MTWHTVIAGNTTTVSAGVASATVALPANAAGNTTGVARRCVLSTVSGGAHVRFVASTGTATDDDYLIGIYPRYMNVPGGATVLAYIAAAATTSTLNIAIAEF